MSEGFAPGHRVAVLTTAPLPPLDYLAGEEALRPGDFVRVPLGPREVIGVVWGTGEGTTPEAKLKCVVGRLALPRLGAGLRRFLDRAADYTLSPPGLMLRLVLRVPDLGKPAAMRTVYGAGEPPPRLTSARQRVLDALTADPTPRPAADLARLAGVSVAVVKGLAEAGGLTARQVPADAPYPPLFGQAPGVHLNAGQEGAAADLRARLEGAPPDKASAVLIRGVTGSGKTEVYLEAVAACIASGRQALVLLPEIALTPAFLDRVEARFGVRPAAWHHSVTGTERRRLWHAAAKGEVSLVVGARSALFLPFAALGLIVVDEEHESAFKQEDGVLYNARDMAVLRASIEGALAVLASATPSLETWANARAGKYTRLDLPERFGMATMPDIALVDLRQHNPGRDRWLSDPLVQAMRARLAAGEQSLLFLNRRGYAPLTLCRACGHVLGCPHCDAGLVAHRLRGRLVCHQCGHEERLPNACPKCHTEDRLAACGPGVERIAEEAAALFPEARLSVLSSDMITSPEEMHTRLDAIARGEADIIVGTQMVAKGHNFPLLTLVGVVDADLGLRGGDLRAAERTFQLLSQVAGRAGRADRPGVALVQTASPDHAVMQALLSGEAEAFWAAEAAARQAAGSPPYGRLAGVVLSGPDETRVWQTGRALAHARAALEQAGAELFGPAPAPIARVRGRVRVRLLVKAARRVALQPALRTWLGAVKPAAGVRVSVDIDPQSFL
ncbi:MAG: primosomal protein N' [Pseudomonadota bacterium]